LVMKNAHPPLQIIISQFFCYSSTSSTHC
jgi:hypothetical protein